MTPYYEDESVTLYHGDCLGVMAEMPERSVDCVITDPPYTERTHKGMRVNVGKTAQRVKLFNHISDEDLRISLEECGRITRRWVIASLAYQHALHFDVEPPTGLRSLRVGVWVKPNPMPQVSGDRPGQGWEALSFMHRDDTKPAWSGGGRSGVWIANIGNEKQGHPTTKPLSMVADFVRLFSAPGDTILDPFAGSGTTLRAALNEGRKAIGVEIDEAYCELIAKRLDQGVLDFGEPA